MRELETFLKIYLKKCVAKGEYQLFKGKHSEVRLPAGK
jgi:hypothetical protein